MFQHISCMVTSNMHELCRKHTQTAWNMHSLNCLCMKCAWNMHSVSYLCMEYAQCGLSMHDLCIKHAQNGLSMHQLCMRHAQTGVIMHRTCMMLACMHPSHTEIANCNNLNCHNLARLCKGCYNLVSNLSEFYFLTARWNSGCQEIATVVHPGNNLVLWL